MARLRLACGLGATIAVAFLPPAALAQPVVPPGNSAASQYTETFPTAGGGTPTKDRGKRAPAKVLGAKTARKFDAQGSQGQAAAVVVTETAPAPVLTSPATKPPTGSAKGRQAKTGSGSQSAGPSGSSGLGEVLAQATGSSSTGQMGLLLPLLVVATVVWSLAYMWRRRRRTA